MRVFIAESNFLVREGLKSLTNSIEDAEFVGEATFSGELIPMLINACPEVLFINYATPLIEESDVQLVMNTLPNIKVIAITDRPDRLRVIKYIQEGIDGHLLYSCDAEEITDAMRSVMKNERFFCGKVLEVIDQENSNKTFTCEGNKLSKRELEVIQLIAEGLSNKEMANQLFLSVHTVLTHRKNLMHKLGAKNTAGIVVFALKNGIHTVLN